MSSIDYKFHPNKKTNIILAPFSGGQPKGGVELGPEYIINAGFENQIKNLGWLTSISTPLKNSNFEINKSDTKDKFNVKNSKIVSDCCKLIYETSLKTLEEGKLPLVLGGDHSIGTATVGASLKYNSNTCVLWVDAHADINTPKTTPSGNLHGCPLSFLLGLDSDSYPPEFSWVPQILKANKLVYIGLRDVDEGEKKILRENNIAAFTMYHIDKYGIGKVIDMALDKVNPERKDPIHLSYDVDAIDPSFVPATGTRVEGGLSLREGLFIAEEIANSGLLLSLDIVETNPMLAETEEHVLDTVSAACAIGRCALGQTLL
ncbi:CAR1 [Candida pseudojiufengensis]|uniref:CAR1 n=1 Tax=Candida pseudojiufengensis TaxID=497109 RepID=UPI0022257D84|nr:CAR1 [Candida pseudojiufengensis]KAI5968176.1 CAR1 [Candida pseudojiufengensis]